MRRFSMAAAALVARTRSAQVICGASARTFAFAVGTPNRLLKLADIGALSFDGMQLLIMDVQANEKQQTIFDVKETAFDLVTLYRKHVHRALLAPQSKLQMFLF